MEGSGRSAFSPRRMRCAATPKNPSKGGEPFAVLHPHAIGDKALDIRELDQFDLAIGDQIGAADIEVIPTATREVFELPAGVVFAKIKLEPDARQSVQQRPVQFL